MIRMLQNAVPVASPVPGCIFECTRGVHGFVGSLHVMPEHWGGGEASGSTVLRADINHAMLTSSSNQVPCRRRPRKSSDNEGYNTHDWQRV